MDYVILSEDQLNLRDLYERVRDASCGAISSFVGTTRDVFEEKTVVTLEYEAHVPMAEKVFKKICLELRAKWNLKHIAIAHRLGVVPVGEESVAVFVSSTHRADSLAAVAAAIDILKASVPIWKKEVYSDGSGSWKENAECAWRNE